MRDGTPVYEAWNMTARQSGSRLFVTDNDTGETMASTGLTEGERRSAARIKALAQELVDVALRDERR